MDALSAIPILFCHLMNLDNRKWIRLLSILLLFYRRLKVGILHRLAIKIHVGKTKKRVKRIKKWNESEPERLGKHRLQLTLSPIFLVSLLFLSPAHSGRIDLTKTIFRRLRIFTPLQIFYPLSNLLMDEVLVVWVGYNPK